MIHGTVLSGSYFDSVMLMAVSQKLKRLPGVSDVALHMGTPTNKAILRSAGLLVPAFEHACAEDLMVAVSTVDAPARDAAMAALEAALHSVGDESRRQEAPPTLGSAVPRLPGANIAVISVPGRYAADEAFAALRQGLHVMIFSDNVSVEEEIALKRFGSERGLMVMGPDCGSAIISGIPLGFANVVARGPVGVASASGTGLQEVSTVVSNNGSGISHAIGVGGRDTGGQVGGIMFLEALCMLGDDPSTRVIVMVSKPPEAKVAEIIAREAARIDRPIVAHFPNESGGTHGPWYTAETLEETGLAAVAMARNEDPATVRPLLDARRTELGATAAAHHARLTPSQRFVRGLFSGGTLCQEARMVMGPLLGEIHSNVGGGLPVADSWTSVAHTLVDMGADEFTVGRPHPMIDYSLRCRRIAKEADDPEVAVVLLDVVLGYGAHPDPSAELGPAIRDARAAAAQHGRPLTIVAAVTGTEADPQRRSSVETVLRDGGALVAPSNAAAAYLAAAIASGRSA